MTRSEILENYDVENGIIQSPGKFEGEMLYAPYFYAHWLDGLFDDDRVEVSGLFVSVFFISDEDLREFPELTGVREVSLWEDDSGFVHLEESP